MVQIMISVIGVERAPAAVLALHADHPFDGAGKRGPHLYTVARAPGPVQRHDDDGGVIDIGIMVVAVLEGPPSGTQARPARGPIALDLENLTIEQPFDAPADGFAVFQLTGLHQRQHRKAGVPDRRNAGLAIAFVGSEHQELPDGLHGRLPPRVVFGITEGGLRHQRVRHRRKDAAETAFAIGPLVDEGNGGVDRAGA